MSKSYRVIKKEDGRYYPQGYHGIRTLFQWKDFISNMDTPTRFDTLSEARDFISEAKSYLHRKRERYLMTSKGVSK